jgi:hypothetical protein
MFTPTMGYETQSPWAPREPLAATVAYSTDLQVVGHKDDSLLTPRGLTPIALGRKVVLSARDGRHGSQMVASGHLRDVAF